MYRLPCLWLRSGVILLSLCTGNSTGVLRVAGFDRTAPNGTTQRWMGLPIGSKCATQRSKNETGCNRLEMRSPRNATPLHAQHAPYARRKRCPLVGYRKIRTPHKEFPGPRPWISFRIPTERSEAKRCDGCDDSGTTCEADLGRRKGARGRGTGQGRVRGGSKDCRANVLPRGGCALAASDQGAPLASQMIAGSSNQKQMRKRSVLRVYDSRTPQNRDRRSVLQLEATGHAFCASRISKTL